MIASKAARMLVGSFVFSSFSSWAFAVQAQTCEKNEACPQGFSCNEETSAVDCPPVAVCDGGKECASPEPCGQTAVTRECRPASCQSDADCGTSMVCFEHKVSECAAGATTPACAPNEKCEAAPPVEDTCTEKTEKTCTPRYVLPCEEASDCGDGFTCEPDMECTCSGSGGSSSGDPRSTEDAGAAIDAGASYAGFAPVPPSEPAADGGVAADAGSLDGGRGDAAVGGEAPTCECHPLERKHCAPKIIKCESDAQCPSDFSCVAYSDGSASCAASKDADAAVCDAPVQSSDEKLCAPRYDWADWAFGGRGSAEDSGGSGSANNTGTTSGKDDKPQDAEPPTHQGASDAGVEQDAGSMPTSDAACSVTAPGAHARSAGFVLGFVMLALGVSSRKRRSQR